MKRLLLAPLLLALTSCSSDITIKNKTGEKILVKSSTVTSTYSGKSPDLKRLIDKNYTSKRLEVSYAENDISYYREKLTECGKNVDPLCSMYKKSLRKSTYEYGIKQNELKKIQKHQALLVQKNPDLIHKISVSFTPIYVDLNNQKTVGFSDKVDCFNPLLKTENQELPNLWVKYSSKLNKERLQRGIQFNEICEKYAKF